MNGANVSKPHEDRACSGHHATKDPRMISSSDASVDSQESVEVSNAVQNMTIASWPLIGIERPIVTDCLTGRGGGSNYHPGNIKYRALVHDNKEAYKASSREKKSSIAMKIVNNWRSQAGGRGRFLKLNETSRKWDDIGDDEARVKVSQALREKRPSKLFDQARANPILSTGIENTEPEPNKGRQRLQPTNSSQYILAECLIAVGIHDFSLLSSKYEIVATQASAKSQPMIQNCIEEEFQSIKQAYFQRILCLHPDSSPRSPHASFLYTRAAFEVLKTMFHKLRVKRTSFSSLFKAMEVGNAGDFEYVHDLYKRQRKVFSHSACPSYQHFAIAATQETPRICVATSNGCHQCIKCATEISSGDIKIGREDSQWLHIHCWNVPLDLWMGLTQPLDPESTWRDAMSMDEVVVKGLSILDYASQLEFVRYIMNRKRWVVTRADGVRLVPPPTASAICGSMSLGNQTLNLERKMSPGGVSQIARPLKKRAVAAELSELEAKISIT